MQSTSMRTQPPESIEAVRFHQFGDADKLQIEQIPIPMANTNQLLIKVYAASVNPVDAKIGSGIYQHLFPIELPWTPGSDFAGVVWFAGRNVSGFRPGDQVFGNSPGGGAFARYIVADPNIVAHKPNRLSFPDAASVPVAAQTAWEGLFEHGQLEAGQSVLIHGGSGGVGTFAVQLAAWKGANVIATASAENLQYVSSLGADTVIDYGRTKFESVVKNVDLVFDLIGGETQERSFDVLKKNGLLVATSQPPNQKRAEEKKVNAMMMHMRPSAKRLERIAELISDGQLRTVVTETFRLSEIKDAWLQITSQHTRGKIVVEINS